MNKSFWLIIVGLFLIIALLWYRIDFWGNQGSERVDGNFIISNLPIPHREPKQVHDGPELSGITFHEICTSIVFDPVIRGDELYKIEGPSHNLHDNHQDDVVMIQKFDGGFLENYCQEYYKNTLNYIDKGLPLYDSGLKCDALVTILGDTVCVLKKIGVYDVPGFDTVDYYLTSSKTETLPALVGYGVSGNDIFKISDLDGDILNRGMEIGDEIFEECKRLGWDYPTNGGCGSNFDTMMLDSMISDQELYDIMLKRIDYINEYLGVWDGAMIYGNCFSINEMCL